MNIAEGAPVLTSLEYTNVPDSQHSIVLSGSVGLSNGEHIIQLSLIDTSYQACEVGAYSKASVIHNVLEDELPLSHEKEFPCY